MDSVAARLEELARAGSAALFPEIVEPMCDSFEAADCDRYAELFVPVIARALPDAEPRRARPAGRFAGAEPSDVFVLSRVTLGADVAVTSVVLDAAMLRFPAARVHLVGPRKNWELFAGNPRVLHAVVEYGRGAGLVDRLEAGLSVREVVDRPGAIVIDPDSRLTQLGLIPVTGDDRYFFWESRSYGGDGAEPLGKLAARWMGEVFGVDDAYPFVAPAVEGPEGRVCVSLGVGGNAAKRVADPFERDLMSGIAAAGLPVLVDHGAGGEESERVSRAVEGLIGIEEWRGAFAPFAAAIARARLYVGYDSAGQHVAAAAGVHGVTVFTGYPNERFLRRWTPWGRGPAARVVARRPFLEGALAAVRSALG
ncbi:MAG: hypothetical protein R2729_00975 [Bryobacteraceae bacterium]